MSDELKVVPSAWHYHMYLWWLSHSKGNRPGYKENLCHYMRVVLLYVPFLWMFTPLWGPFKPYLGLGILVTVGMGMLNLYWGTFALLIFVILVVMDFTMGIYDFFDKSRGRRFRLWFFGTSWFYVISPWSVALVGILILSFLALGVQSTIAVLTTIGLFLGGVGLACLLILFISLAKALLGERFGLLLGDGKGEKGTSSIVLAWQYVKAKKRRICPFIVLPASRG